MRHFPLLTSRHLLNIVPPFEYRSLTTTHHSFKVHMERSKKTQIAELLLVAATLLVIVTPLLSTATLRRANLYLFVNIIIIAVAAEAGIFSFFLVPAENKKPAASVVSQNPEIISGGFPYRKEKKDGTDRPHQSAMATQVVESRCPDKIFGAFHEVRKAPSIFFIGCDESTETEAKYVADDEGEEVGELISRQELFHKAEIFIGNFYKQLNIQREESWKKLHDFIN